MVIFRISRYIAPRPISRVPSIMYVKKVQISCPKNFALALRARDLLSLLSLIFRLMFGIQNSKLAVPSRHVADMATRAMSAGHGVYRTTPITPSVEELKIPTPHSLF